MNKCILLLALAASCASAWAVRPDNWVCWAPDGILVDQLVVPDDTKPSTNPRNFVSVDSKKTTVSAGQQFSVPDAGADGGYSTVSVCVDNLGLVRFLGERRPVATGRLGGTWYNYAFEALKPGKVRVLIMGERLWGSHDKSNRVKTFVIKGGKK